MTHGTAAAAGGAAGYHIMANAIKASGCIVEIASDDFMTIVECSEAPLIVYSAAGVFSKHKYLTSFRGFCFYTKTAQPLRLPDDVALIAARKVWIPG